MDDTAGVDVRIRHKLAPAAIPFDRAAGWIAAVSISIPLLLGLLIGYWITAYPPWVYGLAAIIWVSLSVWLVWLAEVWPRRTYEATSYVVDQAGVEIWRGVHWRAIIAVPRSRVQHIDVLQGPLRRRFGLAALVIFTAGSEHSSVRLDNLEHQVALDLRDQLLPQASDDGI